MTCKEAIGIMGDFLEQSLDQGTGARLDAHLRDCEECRVYLNTYQRTRELTRRAGRVEMPEEVERRVRRFLLDHLSRDTP